MIVRVRHSYGVVYWALAMILAACQPATATLEATVTIPANAPVGEGIYFVARNGSDTNPGTIGAPWATIQHAAEVLQPGETVYIRSGTYRIKNDIRPAHPGTPDGWIRYAAYPGETPIVDGQDILVGSPTGEPPYEHDQGVFQIENVSYIEVKGLIVRNSHKGGITIRDSHHIDIIGCTVENTFSPGISAWDTNHDQRGTDHIRILGNTVTNANTWDMMPGGYTREGEPPHEAISIGGATDFEVAYNLVYESDKEGIDVKETSKGGKVHHNYIHHVDRQCLYIDSWFGVLEDIEMYENVVHDCKGAGIVVSVEGGKLAKNLRIHHNLVYNSLGTGFFFSRWGDGPREEIWIYNNTFYHNGYGNPNPPTQYHWITGGVYFYSTNLKNIHFFNNIVSENQAFQLGYSEYWLRIYPEIEKAFAEQQIEIAYNLLYDPVVREYPVYAGWAPNDFAQIFAFTGEHAVSEDPLFVNPAEGDFRLKEGSLAIDAGNPAREYLDEDGTASDLGAFPYGEDMNFWWKESFPPVIENP